jgi:very-short-patch-repair endonuclease
MCNDCQSITWRGTKPKYGSRYSFHQNPSFILLVYYLNKNMEKILTQQKSQLLSQRPNLEELFKVGSISKTEKLFFDITEQELGEAIIRQVRFGKWLVDAITEQSGVVMEFDGPRNHQSPEKQAKDERRDRELFQNYKIDIIYRLLWFDWVIFQEYHKAVEEAAKRTAKDIKTLIKFSKLKK